MRIVIVGAGNLGCALARGWLREEALRPGELQILARSDRYKERAPELEPFVTYEPSCLEEADVVVIAVKPKDIPAALPILRRTHRDAIIVSVAAGVTLTELATELPEWALARAMPNICAAVGRAATALAFHMRTQAEERKRVWSLFLALGHTFEAEEALFDAITALSGSGPAYVYLILDVLTQAGEQLGLPRDLARRLAARTFEGAARMALNHPEASFEQLIRQVASPGGTTEAALRRMTDLSLEAALLEGVLSANERAAALRLRGAS